MRRGASYGTVAKRAGCWPGCLGLPAGVFRSHGKSPRRWPLNTAVRYGIAAGTAMLLMPGPARLAETV